MAEPRWNRSLIALVAAWVVVLAVLAGGAGYVALQRLGSSAPAAPEPLPEEPRSGMVLELPSNQVSLLNGGGANGQGQPSEADAPAAVSEPVTTEEPAGQEPAAEASSESPSESPSESQASGHATTAEGGEPGTATEQGAQDGGQGAQETEPPAELQVLEEEAPQEQAQQDDTLPQAPEQQPAEGTAQQAAEGQEGAVQGEGVPQQEAALPPSDEPPWQQFATAFDENKLGPRVAIVLSGLGLSAAATEAAIKQLPPEITLSFSPYARLLNQWIALARANGHEVMLDLPMEPLSFPEDDPGPHALLTVLDEEQNQKRLDWLLRRGTSYVGVSAVMGSRFTASPEHMRPILDSLKERGLLFLDNRSSQDSAASGLSAQIGLPLVVNDRTLDEAQASRVAINARLSEIERLARENGAAVAMAQPYPVTIERLRDWSQELESRGFVLAPVTALAEVPAISAAAEPATSESATAEPATAEPATAESDATSGAPASEQGTAEQAPEQATQ